MRMIVFSFFLASAAGCEYFDASLKKNPISTNIRVALREVPENGSKRLVLLGETEKNYACHNLPIISEIERTADRITVTYKEIGQTTPCQPAMGPAVCQIDLGYIPEGNYYFEINNANLKNRGVLSISGSKIEMIFPEVRGIKIENPALMRIPSHTFWGTIGYNDEHAASLIESFLQKLEQEGAEFGKHVPGNYGYFEVGESGNVIPSYDYFGVDFVKPILFTCSGDENRLKELIRSFGESNRSKLFVDIFSYDGDPVFSRAASLSSRYGSIGN